MAAIYKTRRGQVAFEKDVDLHRISAFLTRRQYGKTTNAARIALKKMMREAGHTVVFGSVKLDLGREIVRKEGDQMSKAYHLVAQQAAASRLKLELVDSGTGKIVKPSDMVNASLASDRKQSITADDFAELYESQRLEFRLNHSRTLFSRTKVVALTPEAVGETGDLILDEVGRVKKFREVWEAVKPIISSNPAFRCILTTTPPPDDTHFSFELLAPPTGFDPAPNPEGNTYRSELGVFVRRVTAWDAAADDIPLYDDDTGEALTPEESRRRDYDKDGWDRNYGVKFIVGGTAACSLPLLEVAQKRGAPGGELPCEFFQVQADSDFDRAMLWLADHITGGTIGIGWDVATTEKKTSNPTAVTILERVQNESVARLILTWKTADPGVDRERIGALLRVIKRRPAGGRARRLCIDGTNERKFAADMRTLLRPEIYVEVVIASESVERPGLEKPINMKQLLGANLVGELDDNHLTLPPHRYIREDFRLVKKEKGQFVCEPDDMGRHGDTFDSTKLALRASVGTKGRTIMPAPEMGNPKAGIQNPNPDAPRRNECAPEPVWIRQQGGGL